MQGAGHSRAGGRQYPPLVNILFEPSLAGCPLPLQRSRSVRRRTGNPLDDLSSLGGQRPPLGLVKSQPERDLVTDREDPAVLLELPIRNPHRQVSPRQCRSQSAHLPMGGQLIGQTGGMDREGRQELHYRALEGDVPGIRERLAAGDDIGLADKQGFTALHFAAQQSQTEAVGALLEAGAPIDPQNRFGNTPLGSAVFSAQGRGETVGLLLKAGSDPDIRNEAGATPRDLANRIGAESVAALFTETH
jgi:uncharacterized protein